MKFRDAWGRSNFKEGLHEDLVDVGCGVHGCLVGRL